MTFPLIFAGELISFALKQAETGGELEARILDSHIEDLISLMPSQVDPTAVYRQ